MQASLAEFGTKAAKILTPFTTTYLAQQGYSALTNEETENTNAL